MRIDIWETVVRKENGMDWVRDKGEAEERIQIDKFQTKQASYKE